MKLRSLNRNLSRTILRHTTRMLGGVRRPPPPEYLAIACRALEEVIKVDLRLRPFMQEQIRLQNERVFHEQIEAALDRVFRFDDKESGARLR